MVYPAAGSSSVTLYQPSRSRSTKNWPFSSEKNVPRLFSSPVVVLLEPYQTSNFAPLIGLPVMLSTLFTVKVGFLWFSK